MRAAAIYAFLIASAIEARPQSAPMVLPESDRMPYRLRIATEGHWYQSQSAEAEKTAGESWQASLYSSLSFEPLDFALFHIGLRTRSTSLPGTTESLQEWVALNLAGSLEILPGFLFGTFGVHLPLSSTSASLVDSSAYQTALNGYSPLPERNILPRNAVHAGAYLRQAWGRTEMVGSGVLHWPGSFEFYPGYRQKSAVYHAWTLALVNDRGLSRHEAELRYARYLPESDPLGDAHREGDLYRMRYGVTFPVKMGVLSWAIGAAYKTSDANRSLQSGPGNLRTTEENDNYQKVLGELSLMLTPGARGALQLRWSPQLLYANRDGVGAESVLGASWWVGAGTAAGVRLTPSFLLGRIGDQNHYGGGLRLEYSRFSEENALHVPIRSPK